MLGPPLLSNAFLKSDARETALNSTKGQYFTAAVLTVRRKKVTVSPGLLPNGVMKRLPFVRWLTLQDLVWQVFTTM